MRSRLLLLLLLPIVSVLFVACPMPQLGMGPSKSAADGTDPTAPPAGQIAVVNDTERNQAVYINENGVHFDVVAEEYPGGPMVKCVEVADFTLVPPSEDSEALEVKAIVAGTRDDGMPGVWEIHSDDTILIPQPETATADGSRSIVGGDLTTLPEGIQIRFGWRFHVSAVSGDGRMLVGYADNPNGVTIGGVQIPSGTTIGVYWRVYRLPYTRICIVSPPRIIGSFEPQPMPTKWATQWHGLSILLAQLKLYLTGTLQSYLVKATAFCVDPASAAAASAGVYCVMGTNQDGLPAEARIDRYGAVTMQVTVPDLAVSGVTVTTASGSPPEFTDEVWRVSATLANFGTAPATSVKVKFWLLPNTTTPLDEYTLSGPLAVGQSIQVQSPRSYSADRGTYIVRVTSEAAPENKEIDLSDNSAESGEFTLGDRTTASADLTVSVLSSSVPVTGSGSWSASVTVRNGGPGAAGVSVLRYSFTNAATPGAPATDVGSASIGALAPGAEQTVEVSGTVAGLDGMSGTHHILFKADADSQVAESNESNNTGVAVVPVIYPEVVIDTYYPLSSGGSGFEFLVIDLFGPAGDTTTEDPWIPPATAALASDGVGGMGSNPDPSQSFFAYIDYTGGLAPGDYYVRIRGFYNNTGSVGAYAIRLLTAGSGSHAGWFSTELNLSDTPYETDDQRNGVPARSAALAVNQSLNRYLSDAGGDIDWVKITLP